MLFFFFVFCFFLLEVERLFLINITYFVGFSLFTVLLWDTCNSPRVLNFNKIAFHMR